VRLIPLVDSYFNLTLVADMFQGERYGLNDLVLLEFFKRRRQNGKNTKKIFFYYDVNCRHKPHFIKLLEQLAKDGILLGFEMEFLVNAMHVKEN
jgi:hypothetical protein